MFQDRKSLGQEVVEVIKEGIRAGDFVPGGRIVESRLARDLGLSLTPVREAVRELVGEGILVVNPNRGPSVRILSPHDAFELYTLRAQLEGLAIRLAILRSTAGERDGLARHFREMEHAVSDPSIASLQDSSRQIHEGIVQISHHERLIAIYSSLSLQIALLNRLAAETSDKAREVLWHQPLIDALLGGDPADGERIMQAHIRESYEGYVRAFAANHTGTAPGLVAHEWV